VCNEWLDTVLALLLTFAIRKIVGSLPPLRPTPCYAPALLIHMEAQLSSEPQCNRRRFAMPYSTLSRDSEPMRWNYNARAAEHVQHVTSGT
jgi:hypothetical protein